MNIDVHVRKLSYVLFYCKFPNGILLTDDELLKNFTYFCSMDSQKIEKGGKGTRVSGASL